MKTLLILLLCKDKTPSEINSFVFSSLFSIQCFPSFPSIIPCGLTYIDPTAVTTTTDNPISINASYTSHIPPIKNITKTTIVARVCR